MTLSEMGDSIGRMKEFRGLPKFDWFQRIHFKCLECYHEWMEELKE